MIANTYENPGTTGGNREDLLEGVSILEPEETPFVSTTNKRMGTKSTFVETLSDRLRNPRNSGSPEGGNATGNNNKAKDRKRFGTFIHRFFDEYAVTDVQEDVSRAGGNAATTSEVDRSEATTLREIKRDMEATMCGDQEMQGGSEENMRTRGAFCWLETALQTTNAVPTDFMPDQTNAVLTAKTSLTEADLQTVLKSLMGQYGVARSFDLFLGTDYLADSDDFMRVGPGSNERYRTTSPAGSHTIELMVTTIVSSFGRLNLIPDLFLKGNDDGAGGVTGDPKAALIRNADLWEIQFLEAPFSKRKGDEDGGGESGWIRAKAGLLNKNPRGNGVIYNT